MHGSIFFDKVKLSGKSESRVSHLMLKNEYVKLTEKTGTRFFMQGTIAQVCLGFVQTVAKQRLVEINFLWTYTGRHR